MSFADKAVKVILEQLKKEGIEFVVNPEKCNTGKYKELHENFTQHDENIDFLKEDPLDKKTVPEIIDSFRTYYLLTGKAQSDMIVAEPVKEYSIGVLRESAFPGSNLGNYNQEFYRSIESNKKIIETLDKALLDYLSTPEKKVCDFIIKKQNKLHLKASEVYNPVYMTKQTYSRVISNQTQPNFNTCIQFAFALQLNIKETNELLQLAGNAFRDSSPNHRVIKYYIEHKKYSMYELNKCLDALGLDIIGG